METTGRNTDEKANEQDIKDINNKVYIDREDKLHYEHAKGSGEDTYAQVSPNSEENTDEVPDNDAA